VVPAPPEDAVPRPVENSDTDSAEAASVTGVAIDARRGFLTAAATGDGAENSDRSPGRNTGRGLRLGPRVVSAAFRLRGAAGASATESRAAPVDRLDPEFDDADSEVSAHAVPAPEYRAAPTPRATANPPTRPTNREALIVPLNSDE
jgi:hypothetical protein